VAGAERLNDQEYVVHTKLESFQQFHLCEPDNWRCYFVGTLNFRPELGLTLIIKDPGYRPIEAALLDGLVLALNHMQDLCAFEGVPAAEIGTDIAPVRDKLIRTVFAGRDDLITRCLEAVAKKHDEDELDPLDSELADILEEIITHDVVNESEVRSMRSSLKAATIKRLVQHRDSNRKLSAAKAKAKASAKAKAKAEAKARAHQAKQILRARHRLRGRRGRGIVPPIADAKAKAGPIAPPRPIAPIVPPVPPQPPVAPPAPIAEPVPPQPPGPPVPPLPPPYGRPRDTLPGDDVMLSDIGNRAPDAKRARVGIPFGPWNIAPLAVGGWGATCGEHVDVNAPPDPTKPRTVCKRNLPAEHQQFPLSLYQCRCRMKQWLLVGVAIPEQDRALHMGVAVRETEPLPGYTEAELDAQADKVLLERVAAAEEAAAHSPS